MEHPGTLREGAGSDSTGIRVNTYTTIERMEDDILRSMRIHPERWVIGGAAALMALSFAWNWISRPADYIPRDRVWTYVERRAPEYGLDPRFVFAIIKAESTFNANAHSQGARGMMQLRRPAWETVTDRPFRHAWRWKVNVDQGMAYLSFIRTFLEERDAFSYPRLAAGYRYGPYGLEREEFDLSRMPTPRNEVYQAIFAGDPAPVKIP